MNKQPLEKKFDYKIKLLVLGDQAVGKTCLLLRYCENCFSLNHMVTMGVEYKVKNIEIDDKLIRTMIYDTGGQERFRCIVNSFYKGAHGIVLAYSCDNRPSFDNVEHWMRQIKENTDDNVRIILVCTKKDLPQKDVTFEEGKQLADKYNIKFFETSSKIEGDQCIQDAFYTLCKEIKDNLASKTVNEEVTRKVTLTKSTHKNQEENENDVASNKCC